MHVCVQCTIIINLVTLKKRVLVYRWLEFSHWLSKYVAVGKMLVQNAKNLLIQPFVGTDTLHKLLDILKERELNQISVLKYKQNELLTTP